MVTTFRRVTGAFPLLATRARVGRRTRTPALRPFSSRGNRPEWSARPVCAMPLGARGGFCLSPSTGTGPRGYPHPHPIKIVQVCRRPVSAAAVEVTGEMMH
jgi:hypothetical protein